MKRREFLESSLAAAAVGSLSTAATVSAAAEEGPGATPEFYELRLYHQRMGPRQRILEEYLRHGAVPALNRAGISPVGVFNVMVGPEGPTTYLLLPCASMTALLGAWRQVEADGEYQRAAAEFLNAPADAPVYIRMESSFMVAFEGMPKLEVPAEAAGNKPRIFELRTYESASEKAAKKKIEMFNRGEIAIFRRTGLRPVFFGQALIGSKLPHLTYMVVFENLEQRTANWSAFSGDAEWKKLSTTPGYVNAEIVSNITNVLLSPAAFSQI